MTPPGLITSSRAQHQFGQFTLKLSVASGHFGRSTELSKQLSKTLFSLFIYIISCHFPQREQIFFPTSSEIILIFHILWLAWYKENTLQSSNTSFSFLYQDMIMSKKILIPGYIENTIKLWTTYFPSKSLVARSITKIQYLNLHLIGLKIFWLASLNLNPI